jgi:Leucine-rich repeat (LRR) protein
LSLPSFSFSCFFALSFTLSTRLSKWEGEIDRLDAFKHLTRLILNSNSITSITIPAPSNDGARIQFQEVMLLALAKNKVCAWESVDALGRLPNLKEVRLQDNPLADELRPGAIRQVIIAKVN